MVEGFKPSFQSHAFPVLRVCCEEAGMVGRVLAGAVSRVTDFCTFLGTLSGLSFVSAGNPACIGLGRNVNVVSLTSERCRHVSGSS